MMPVAAVASTGSVMFRVPPAVAYQPIKRLTGVGPFFASHPIGQYILIFRDPTHVAIRGECAAKRRVIRGDAGGVGEGSGRVWESRGAGGSGVAEP